MNGRSVFSSCCEVLSDTGMSEDVTAPAAELIIRRNLLFSVVYTLFGLVGMAILITSLSLPGSGGSKIVAGVFLVMFFNLMAYGALGFIKHPRAGSIILTSHHVRWVSTFSERSLLWDDVLCFDVEKDTGGDATSYKVIARLLDDSRRTVFYFVFFRSGVLANAVEILIWLEDIRQRDPDSRAALFASAPLTLRTEMRAANSSVLA
jgi:hypothetical protein